jgi:hypothetical protein
VNFLTIKAMKNRTTVYPKNIVMLMTVTLSENVVVV